MPSYRIKLLILSIVLLRYITACQSKNSNLDDWDSDTLNVEYSEFSYRKFQSIENRTLVRRVSKDTTTFRYFDDSLNYRSEYILYKTSNGEFALLGREFGLVKTFYTSDSVLLLKFEIIDPLIDGAGALIINPELGEIAGYSYSWGNQGVLNKFGGNIIPEKLIEILLSDSLLTPIH